MSTHQPDVILPGLERCPCCGRGLLYLDGTSNSRELLNHASEVTVPSHGDQPLYRECRSCGARWHRHHPASTLRGAAERYVDAWPAFGFRAPLDAWLPTAVRIFDGKQSFDVLPDATNDASHMVAPLAGPMYVVTAWNPGGRPATLAQNEALQRRMDVDARHRGWHVRQAAVFDTELRWAERSTALLGLSERDAVTLAREYAQPALLKWSEAGVTVLTSDTGTALGAAVPVTIRRRSGPTCPMRTIARDPQEGVVCRNPGGPWVSASIHESARWRLQRAMLLSTIGCNVCHAAHADGPGGRSLDVYPQLVASRYGPGRSWLVQSQARSANEW